MSERDDDRWLRLYAGLDAELDSYWLRMQVQDMIDTGPPTPPPYDVNSADFVPNPAPAGPYDWAEDPTWARPERDAERYGYATGVLLALAALAFAVAIVIRWIW